MYSAPPVSYPVGRCAFVGWILGGVAALAVGLQMGGAWAAWPNAAWVPWRWAASSGVWALTLGWAAWHWWHSPVGWLIWAPGMADDSPDPVAGDVGWWWGVHAGLDGQAVARVQPMVLAGTWGLLYVELSKGHRQGGLWLWVALQSAPDRWLPLRRALSRHAG